ncbi:NAD(P)H-dependent oxidoreductase subunit E [bacterium]|nr:NAD(P)H-dependent oxidoreductase subunit E [bacterium]
MSDEIQEREPNELIEVLTQLQETEGGLTQETLIAVAKALDISMQQVNSVSSFYSMLKTNNPNKTIRVCDGPVCWINGGAKLMEEIKQLEAQGWVVERNSCLGLCDNAPSALVGERQAGHLNKGDWRDVVDGGHAVTSLPGPEQPGEVRLLLKDVDKIDPEDISTAIDCGIFEGLEKALSHQPSEVVEIVKESGLVGRGGAGFPSGLKWGFVAGVKADQKYVICNADESEPLAVKDRVLIDRNPYLVIAGMIIAGYAIGASEGVIYIRGEYPQQAKKLEMVIQQAEEQNYLGENILGSDFSFRLHVHRGAGAYICGEETALIESLEGRRGEPRLRPPYPTTQGYHHKPTLVNNVETFANVPIILQKGVEWYRSLSDSKYPGTKIYAILGHVAEPRVFEAPFGLSLRQLIDDFGGGMLPGHEFGFALVGGAAGRFAPPELLDLPLDYGSGEHGAHLGVGVALVCDTQVSPVAMLRELLHFFEFESCGKCTPCRVGTRQTRILLDQILAGEAPDNVIEKLLHFSDVMGTASFCGLGISVPWPVRSAITHFRQSFENAGSVKEQRTN